MTPLHFLPAGYFERKTLLNHSKVEWTDFNCDYYVGCRHNCKYCYARKLQRLDESEWIRVHVCKNALELAVREIRTIPKGSRIMVSSMTDPYQYIEQDEQVTRMLIPILAARPDITVILITKSDLVKRDFGLIAEFPNVHLCMTITSFKDLPDLEPDSPGNAARIKCLREANAYGIYTIASIEPWIPKVTNPLQVLQSIWPFVKEVFVGSYNWHYRRGSEPEKDAITEYRAILPHVTKFLEDHMIKYTIKKELRKLVSPQKAEGELIINDF